MKDYNIFELKIRSEYLEQTGSDLESCLDDAYNQYGSVEEKQSWFDDEH